MMSHDDAGALLGAYALDAVDGEERRELEEHLATCPRCRAELDSMREIAGALGNSVEPLPEGLWSNIASRLPERVEEEEPPPMPRLVRDGRPTAAAPAARRRGRIAIGSLAAAAVAAAAVAAVLGIGLIHANTRADNLQTAEARQSSTVAAALATPGHTVVSLRDGKQKLAARFVVVPDGRGYLVSSHLPSLAKGSTYQLWGIVGSEPISLGLLGPDPRRATFTMAGVRRPARLAITSEPTGGSVAPTLPILATGAV